MIRVRWDGQDIPGDTDHAQTGKYLAMQANGDWILDKQCSLYSKVGAVN